MLLSFSLLMELDITSLASNALTAKAGFSYSSMEGVLYCKPHFEQLFKESGSFNKNFQSRM
jgi:hypothetical protein